MCATAAINNYTLVSIPLIVGTGVYTFPNDEVLNSAKKITAFRPMYASTAGMKDPDGNALCDATTFKSGYLEISSKNNEKPISQIPLVELALIPAAGNPQPVVAVNVSNINISKCKIYLGDTSSITAGDVLLVGVYYDNF